LSFIDLFSGVGAGDGLRPHPLANFLGKFRQIVVNLGKFG